jgi:two-component system, chemotaxis family, chemotaxis protein CheY
MKTCLVVEDSKVMRRIARKMLEELGFAVEEAEDGKVALEKTQAKMPDMVLLDWNMPVMNGLEYLLALRALPNGSTPTVVLCTTETDLSQIVKAMESGANEYIMKPYDRDILESKLVQVGMLEAKDQ